MLSLIAAALALSGTSMAHGGGEHHGQKPMVDANANWMTKHMAGMSDYHDSSINSSPKKRFKKNLNNQRRNQEPN